MEENNKILPIEIAEEMKKSYIDYSMSVIAGRALPDVRDGLKPVHRRILYSMSELNLTPDKPYRKSARIVGDVLGKYHPHGDTAVYFAMVRMAQDFSTRALLVDGHGNFGSVDGDSPAAMRYTEAKMSKLSLELLRDIEKETVDFKPNFDESLKEPSVLPARYPNLLVNGSNGIAVGMATSIPPHNLAEVIDATVHLIDNPDCSVEDLIKFIQGPDFPTAAIIMGKENIAEAYRTGRGKVKVRSRAFIEELPKGKQQIIVTEIPYQVNKAKLVERIAELVKEKRIEGISDLRDESNRNGMRIVIELKRDANANIVLNNLYKHSQMEDTFSIIMLALVDGQPRVLNLKQILYHYIKHQEDVVTRRTKFELNKAEARAHILEGLKIALDNIDAVISLIRASKTGQEAKIGLVEKFNLTEIQAQAILDMRLQRLTGLERDKIEAEYEDLIKKINRLKEILADERLLLNVIKDEMTIIKENYSDERRTEIRHAEGEIDMRDLISDEEIAITLTHFGYIKRLPSDTYKSQKRGGRGISALTTREEDFVRHLITTTTHSRLLFFTNKGRVFKLNAYEIPEGKRQAKGTAIVNLLQLSADEKIATLIPIDGNDENEYLLLTTKKGIVKKTKREEFKNINKSGLIAIGLRDDDELIGVELTDGKQEVLLVTNEGMSIRFDENDIRYMGRTAMGVKGITLSKKDFVVSMNLCSKGTDVLVVSRNGFGKRTNIEEYRSQIRAGKGIKTYNISEKTGTIVGAEMVNEDDEIMIINSDGVLIRIRVNEISLFGRVTSGVKLMKTNEEVNVVSIAKINIEEE
ncbi:MULTISPECIES: DNA gyrase subunit A [unclassified Clostridioides]|uniref:DNA gyrase subunit A n=1 Tax=unclassified Clostridioides TaxID=2635829 RepID=UPI001D0C93AA|nr:DNA gyrase subunit A [Clostridioides sp. ES-S-0001-02]MCC0641386.1 DNA gyrase subunit A [Clostridioides sp. ES-S-0049-03]MCC0653952.1 DNA gyrase subunit A [Clostridioides sp. ES-S-0001-03]MCC0658173.1 DNA gyrase subunit A [Clostridioides sp. ES-S-0123-01]MCC0670851.1 DNA gyrase subunit A [Clostridioides sp. ES-S-0145-01]MCC0677602.1 DNA gyrase subunit A [Clostridioides sp. ES-W-0018-02]MCC0682105.1 DNA gyrase subunit A [Clostridioides sp. ES-S-0005-03]MCC0697362.1 DNA gyrase subunit A [Cl